MRMQIAESGESGLFFTQSLWLVNGHPNSEVLCKVAEITFLCARTS